MESEIPTELLNTLLQSTSTDRPGRKKQRRVGKKTKATPLARIIDEILDAFDKSISVHEIIKWNKIDNSLMDWKVQFPLSLYIRN